MNTWALRLTKYAHSSYCSCLFDIPFIRRGKVFPSALRFQIKFVDERIFTSTKYISPYFLWKLIVIHTCITRQKSKNTMKIIVTYNFFKSNEETNMFCLFVCFGFFVVGVLGFLFFVCYFCSLNYYKINIK